MTGKDIVKMLLIRNNVLGGNVNLDVWSPDLERAKTKAEAVTIATRVAADNPSTSLPSELALVLDYIQTNGHLVWES